MIFSFWCKTCIISWKGTSQFSKHFLTSCDFVTPSFVEIYFLSGQLCSSWNFLFSPIIGLFIRQSDLHNAFLILNTLIVLTMHTTHYYDWPWCLIGGWCFFTRDPLSITLAWVSMDLDCLKLWCVIGVSCVTREVWTRIAVRHLLS